MASWARAALAPRVEVVNDIELVLAAGTPTGWGVALKEIEKVKNIGRYTSVQRSTAFRELWDRALVLDHKPNVRVLFMKFPNGFKYKVANVIDRSSSGTPVL